MICAMLTGSFLVLLDVKVNQSHNLGFWEQALDLPHEFQSIRVGKNDVQKDQVGIGVSDLLNGSVSRPLILGSSTWTAWQLFVSEEGLTL
jgi:hypothetical protein